MYMPIPLRLQIVEQEAVKGATAESSKACHIRYHLQILMFFT